MALTSFFVIGASSFRSWIRDVAGDEGALAPLLVEIASLDRKLGLRFVIREGFLVLFSLIFRCGKDLDDVSETCGSDS
jgi:hydrogenase-4 membrane subunit HyfE